MKLARDMSTVRLFVIAVLLGVAVAEVPEWSKCEGYPDDVCDISEIRITPCKNIKYCQLKKGKDAKVQMDYTPNFAANKLDISMFWASDNGDVPFPDVQEVNACPYTSCPHEVGKKESFDYKMHISKKLPIGKFPIKIKVSNSEDRNQTCCFRCVVELKK